MNLLLWRWSTAVQVTSVLMIAAFFLLLTRSVKRVELRWWVRAWIADVGALAVTAVYWFWQPPGIGAFLLSAAYLALKTTWLVLLAHGTWMFVRPNSTGILRAGRFAILCAAISPVVLSNIPKVGVGQHGVLAIVCASLAIAVLRAGDRDLVPLAAALFVRAALAGIESSAYATQLLPDGRLSADLTSVIGTFLSSASSIDTASEWFIALAGVLAMSARIQRDLRASNSELLGTQDELRRLIDRDPLTALANQRALPAILRAVQPSGATVLFFDLDDFKRINDEFGHSTGDACLRRFADALRESFRPNDQLLRYGGDEFIAIAEGLDATLVQQRIERLRALLQFPLINLPPVRFSVGISRLEPGGDPSAAIRAADESMYAVKRQGTAAVAGD